MSEADFFPKQDLTPEEKVAQNARLRNIDKEMRSRAHDALIDQQDGSDMLQLDKDELITRLSNDIPEYAKRLSEKLDTDFESARNFTVSRIVQKPSRLPFLNRDVSVIEQVEIAAWTVSLQIEDHIGVIIGRDGVLYAVADRGSFYPLHLPSLSTEDLRIIEKALAEFIEGRDGASQQNGIS